MIQGLRQEARDGKTTESSQIREREVCHCDGRSEVGQSVHQVRQMKQLQVQNTRVKQLVAEPSLDETMLQDVLRKKW